MSRVIALLPPTLIAIAMACGGETKSTGGGPAPSPGAGYGAPDEDIRTLSRDDCLSLRDHQIEIAVAAISGVDEGRRLEVEAKLRAEHKAKSEDWVKKCSGKSVPAKLLRCWKESSTPASLVACETPLSDAGADARDTARDTAADGG